MFNKNLISNRTLIIRIILLLITTSILAIFFSSTYLKKIALNNLGEDDAKKTSELIFEIMNTKMQEGWGKNDLNIILDKLEHIREGLEVKSYRSQKVEEILGVHEEDKKIVTSDTLIQKALAGEKQFLIEEDGSIRYLYPMKVSQECITCHYNTKVGDVNGVLDIKYPPNEIKISLDMLIQYFLIFFISFIIVCFMVLFIVINKKIITPIMMFSDKINEISHDADLSKRSNIQSNIKEINLLENNFNLLLEKIKYYYKELINNIYTDSLTSLPNIQKLKAKIKENETNTLMIINIDSFKQINGFYGLKVGDEILKQTAKNLLELSDKELKVFKLYSDEFAILSKKTISRETCLEIIKKLNEKEYSYENSPIIVKASMGVVLNTKDRTIEKATIALRNAKNKKTIFEEYKNSLVIQDEYTNHITWSNNIKKALDKKNAIAYFQPIKDLRTQKISKYESLSRIIIDHEVYSPALFMNIAKKAKLYPSITRSTIKSAFEFFKDKKDIEFSINYSVEDIANEKTTQYLIEMIEKYKIGSKLIIELLESEEIDDFNLINDFIKKMKTYRVKIAIDDFGSGYSNFSYILKLNVDFLKIDSSLIKDIDKDENSKIIVKTIVEFAKRVDLETIAEMVHKKEIEDILSELGVDYVQGYYIGRPKEGL